MILPMILRDEDADPMDDHGQGIVFSLAFWIAVGVGLYWMF
jgi:hypothetical protein